MNFNIIFQIVILVASAKIINQQKETPNKKMIIHS